VLNTDAGEIEPGPGALGSRHTPDVEDGRDPLERMAEEFLDRMRRGEQPSVGEFLARAPDRAGELDELLSALLFVEDIKPQVDPMTASGGVGVRGGGPALERLGDFRILRELGRGGMGVVYEAEQESLGRHVALKVLAPGVARSPQIIQRFLREARAAAQLHHTNIVPVFGVGERDGLHYFAMQFIRGLSLDKVLEEVVRLKGMASSGPAGRAAATRTKASDTSVARSLATGDFPGPPGPARAEGDAGGRPSLAAATDSDERYTHRVARIGLQVAGALEYAHQQGTLHRDIKPSNLLLDVHGGAWVTDFGLAKAVEDEDLTRTGDLVGTVRYMAPERFRGRCDARSDVYGLGLTLYELLAFRPAFDALDREGLFYQVDQVEPPRLRRLNPVVPADLETIVHKAIEKDAAHRYARAAELAEDLRCFLEDRPIAARRVSSTERLTRWARRNPGLASLGTALAGMLALVVVVIVLADLRLRREHRASVTNLRLAERAKGDALDMLLDSYMANARANRRSRFAGRRFEGLQAIRAAAALDRPRDRRLVLRNEAIACLALPDLRPVRSWEDGSHGIYSGVDFDPTTGRMACGTIAGDVLVREASGGDASVLYSKAGFRAALVRFSPDGRYLAVKHEERGEVTLVVWDVARAQKLLEIPDGMRAAAVDFHPDGATLAAGRRDGSIVLYDLAGRREIRRLSPGTEPHSIRFDPSGALLAVVSYTAREGVQLRSLDDGAVKAAWELPGSCLAVEWHPDGRRLAVGAESGRISLLDAGDPSRPPWTFQAHDGAAVALAFQPRGRLLASASWDGTLRLWDARSAEELVRCPLSETSQIRFSRDGRLLGPGIAGSSMWLWEVAEGVECRTLIGDEGIGARTWSVDFLGRDGVLASAGESGVRLEETGGHARSAFVDLPGTAGMALSPDGAFLTTSGVTGLLRWPVRRSPGGSLRVGPPGPLGPLPGLPTRRVRLGRDGRTLAVVVGVGEVGRVFVFDLQGRRPPVTLTGHPALERLDLSPDGAWVATGTWQGRGVKVWDARRGTLVRALPVQGSADVLFSPDGRWLVTSSGEEYAIWEVGSWALRRRLPRSGATGMPGHSAFSPDGRVLATSRTRSLVQLVDFETGRELATLEPPELRNVSSLGFSPDGRLLIVTFKAAGIQVWDLGAIRRGLAAIGLDWPTTAGDGADAPPPRAIRAIEVEDAPWLEPLSRGEALARSGCWHEAALAFDEAIASGAGHVDAWTRHALLRRAEGDGPGYREACHHLLRAFGETGLSRRADDDIAWACVLGAVAVADESRAVRLAEVAATSGPAPNRPSTLGAALYRAGRFEEAVRQLDRSVEAHGAGGMPFDGLFLAMAYHRLGQAEQARDWLRRGTAAARAAMREANPRGGTSWIPRLQLEILGREAASLIDPDGR
jgi:eukaryotic-like serine/threonine-protein kinase